MLGGVFGDTNGIAPGYKGSLSWQELELCSESEYVFDAGNSSDKFFYTWSELGWAPVDWFRIGFVGSAHEGLQDRLRHPTRIPGGLRLQRGELHHLRLQPRREQAHGGPGCRYELLGQREV